MTSVWTPPRAGVTDALFEASWYEDEIRQNLLFLYEGTPLYVGSLSQDMSTDWDPASANRAVLMPLIAPASGSIAGLSFYVVGNGGANMDVGIYDDDGNGTTATKLKTAGSTAIPAAGLRTVNFTAPQAIVPGEKYWLAVVCSLASPRFGGTKGPSTLLCKTMATALPLPATVTFGGSVPATTPCVGAALT